MAASAPMAMASARFSSLEATAITRAPSDRATSIAASPTPPPAPVTSTTSPGRTTVRCFNANHAVPYTCMNEAPRLKSRPGGSRTSCRGAASTAPANPPLPVDAKTRSPTTNPSTSAPTASITPADSPPGVYGARMGNW